ncbi:unnamed protein product [Closterium sp. NIES-64]|nr:unnamed protein product [Closterium sp. NIES-64]
MNLVATNDMDEIHENPEYGEMGEPEELLTKVDKSKDTDDTGASVEAAEKQEEEIAAMEAAVVNGGDGDGVNTFAAAIVVEDEAVIAKIEGVEAVKKDFMPPRAPRVVLLPHCLGLWSGLWTVVVAHPPAPRRLVLVPPAFCDLHPSLPFLPPQSLPPSTPGFRNDYFRPGFRNGASTWHIHLPPGGWCSTLSACANRSTTFLGSSKPELQKDSPYSNASYAYLGILSTGPFASYAYLGILSTGPFINKAFRNWNLVVPIYCFPPSPYTPVFHPPHASYAYLGILSTGQSAGAQTVLTLCEHMREYAPNAKKIKCLMDSGSFTDSNDRYGQPFFQRMASDIVTLHKFHHCSSPSLSTPPHRSLLHLPIPCRFSRSLFQPTNPFPSPLVSHAPPFNPLVNPLVNPLLK